MDARNCEELYQAIFKRRSVRKFVGKPDDPTTEDIRSFLSTLRPMLSGIRTELRLLSQDDVRGMLGVKAPQYIAAFSEVKDGYGANVGFLLQQMDLFLSAKGIGCCWQMGSKPARKIKGGSDLEFIIMLALGRPAEGVHRQSIAEFKREPLDKISSVEGMDDILEAGRLAPSGLNNQSWYFIGGHGIINAFNTKSRLMETMNRINVGIALCHMWLAATHAGKSSDFRIDPSPPLAPNGYSYVATMDIS